MSREAHDIGRFSTYPDTVSWLVGQRYHRTDSDGLALGCASVSPPAASMSGAGRPAVGARSVPEPNRWRHYACIYQWLEDDCLFYIQSHTDRGQWQGASCKGNDSIESITYPDSRVTRPKCDDPPLLLRCSAGAPALT